VQIEHFNTPGKRTALGIPGAVSFPPPASLLADSEHKTLLNQTQKQNVKCSQEPLAINLKICYIRESKQA
jgi:hypothetical protein